MEAIAKHNCSHGTTKVVFRKWPDGSILALFPEVPAVSLAGTCSSYEHVGQHGGAHYQSCMQRTKPATAPEYADLKAELEKLGYCLQVVKRATQRDHNNRHNQ